MNKIFLLFLFCSQFVFSQDDKVECGWYGKKTVAERNQMFPFNTAKKVIYISFYGTEFGLNEYLDDQGKLIRTDSLLQIHLSKISLKTFSLKNNEKYFAKEFVELNTDQINNLSNLAFNFKIDSKSKVEMMYSYGCYMPRNAILFLDSDDKVFAHTEICFECKKYYSDWNDTFDSLVGVSPCDEVHVLLKALFEESRIKYGITER